MASDRDEPAPFRAANQRQRLTPIDRSSELLPWRRARELTRCCLYWMPVSGFPVPSAQRSWLLEFLKRWLKLTTERLELRHEQFLQYKTVYPDLMKPLLNNMMDLVPILGLGRKPGAPLPPFPSQNDIEGTTKEMFESLKRGDAVPLPDVRKHMPDYTYWFLDKSDEQQRAMFFGHGGLTIACLKPDPKTAPPPLLISPAQRAKLPMFKGVDMDRMWARANSLGDAFLAKSKQLFGDGLQDEPQAKGIPFILPLLDAADFFSQPESVVANCFELFDVYIRESPTDKGVLMALREDSDETLITLLHDMKQDRLTYPES
jgi:hypothetical protein